MKSANRIASVRMESGKEVRAGAFIDASYEGDLMAEAGVTYTVGREANSQYNKKANGIQKGHNSNQLPRGIDPHVIKGNPSSGLLPRVNSDAGGENGEGDKCVQAYCYRMCLTDMPANLIVPVCLAASHIAYGFIRMESVFMILGQSAGTAAALAVEGGTSVQQVPYGKLRNDLERDGQVLKMPASSRPSNGG